MTHAATFVPSAPDSEALRWEAAVVANGGSVTAPRMDLVKALIADLKTADAWNAIDDAWLLVAESATQALTSLKQFRLATVTAAPTFTADAGYAFNGSSQYIDTGFIPSTHAVSMAATSVRIEVYERTNVSANTYAVGVSTSGNRALRIIPRNTSGFIGANAAVGTFTLPAADSRGMTSGSRNGADASTCFGYKNGVLMTRTADPSGFGVSLPPSSIFIGALSNTGTAAQFRASTIGWVSVGAALDDARELASHEAIQDYMTACGANV